MENILFSYFNAPAQNTNPNGEMSIMGAYEYITSNASARVRTQVLRAFQDMDKRRKYKAENFDFACFSGQFAQRTDKELVKHSGLLCLDFDHVGSCDDVCQLRRRLIGDPILSTALSFVSPSGDGLKHVATIDLSKGDHRRWFYAIRDYVRKTYGMEADRTGVNVSRACFLPHDESCYVHPCAQKGMPLPISQLDLEVWGVSDNATRHCDEHTSATPAPAESTELSEEVNTLVDMVILQNIDITQGYEAWRNVGFALADGLGEAGREAFHELSRMNADYDRDECDRQYTKCLHGKGSGVTIRSLFHMAREAGIDLSAISRLTSAKRDFFSVFSDSQPCAETSESDNTLIINDTITDADGCESENCEKDEEDDEPSIIFSETFTEKISPKDWPSVLLPVINPADDHESQDKMMLATLTVMSGMLCYNYYGLYSGHKIYTPLYVIIHGPSASRKGDVGVCQKILEPLHEEMMAKYKSDMDAYLMEHAAWEAKGSKADRGPEPREPQYRTQRIPANSSASAAYQALDANGGCGVMIESEADVLTQSLQSDYGDYSAGLREAFHHEPITMNRVKEKLHIDIREPRLAVCLTCTPGQLPKLFPSFENGLGSRFLFLGLNRKLEWRNPFEVREKTLDEIYLELGKRSLELHHLLTGMGNRNIQFMLTEAQVKQFNKFFSALLIEQFHLSGDGISSFVFRLGVSAFRLAMLLTLLRRYSEWDHQSPLFEDNEQAVICNNLDLNIALTIMNTLINHTGKIYAWLSNEKEEFHNPALARLSGVMLRFYEALGDNFNRKEALECAQELNISRGSADRYLGDLVQKHGVVSRLKSGQYQKVKLKTPRNHEQDL